MIYLALITPLLLSAFVTGVGGETSRGYCCQFKSDRAPAWSTVLQPSAPEKYINCDWYPDMGIRLAFSGPKTVIAALHEDCFLKNGAIPPIPAHTLDTLLAVDAPSGNIIKRLALKDISREMHGHVELWGLTGNRVLLRSGLALKMYNSDLKELRSRTLESQNVRTERWATRVSADGKSILLRHWSEGKDTDLRSEDHWLSPETLEDVLSIRTAPYDSNFAISNDRVFYNPPRHGGAPLREDPIYTLRAGDREGSPLCDGCTGATMGVTANNLLIVDHGSGAELWLIEPNGKVILRKKFGEAQDSLYHAVVSPHTSLFIFSFGHSRDFMVTRGIDAFVAYDAEAKRERFRLHLTTYPQNEGDGLQVLATPSMSLSPALTQLMVLDGFVLKSFALP